MIRAADVVTLADELALLLQNASRVNPDSESNRALRALLKRPDVLDELERAVALLRKARA